MNFYHSAESRPIRLNTLKKGKVLPIYCGKIRAGQMLKNGASGFKPFSNSLE